MENNNKLIAEFMELEASPKYNTLMALCNPPKEYYIKEYNSGEWYLPEEMQYHTSWDWLMPVIEKCLVGEAEQSEEISNTTIKNIYEGICNQDISFAYKSVVEFIKSQNN